MRKQEMLYCLVITIILTWLVPANGIAQEGSAVLHNYGKLPLSFVPNAGQTEASVAFTARNLGGTLFFTSEEIVLALPAKEEDEPAPVLRMQFDGMNLDTAIKGGKRLPGVANYFMSNDPARWRINIPTYSGLTYAGLYPGIDLYYEGTDGQLKSTYIVAPGADPTAIRWRYTGAKDIRIDPETHDLVIAVETGTAPYILREEAPIAWQKIGEQQVPVNVQYTLTADGNLGFEVEQYDPTVSLVIDPLTLVYSTYLGGAMSDYGYDITVDDSRSVYVVGYTTSVNFPTQTPYQTDQGGTDMFVTKLSPMEAALSTAPTSAGAEATMAIASQWMTVAMHTSADAQTRWISPPRTHFKPIKGG